jgi:NAD(P)H-hydrate epimerase
MDGEQWLMRHRFVSPGIAKKYDFEVPEYQGANQFVEVGVGGQKL